MDHARHNVVTGNSIVDKKVKKIGADLLVDVSWNLKHYFNEDNIQNSKK